MNYQNKMQEIIKSLSFRPKLLLHSCCGPCSTTVLTLLVSHFDITVLYYNPNIEPKEEYYKRKDEQIRFIMEFNNFGTTLTVSPHKNSEVINKIGALLETEYGVKYLYSYFKKKDGYKRSIELSKKYNLYRQDYCGCEFGRTSL